MINANEQRVIGAAQGTFEYQGEIYTARPIYVQQLKRKLNSKDTQLTAEQATSAIQSMYGNIERGVKEGYLMKLSRTQAKKAKEQGKVQKVESILSKPGKKKSTDVSKDNKAKASSTPTTRPSEKEQVEGANGEMYTVQEKPLDVTNLDQLRVADVDTIYSHTSNQEIAQQIQKNTYQMITIAGISWLACILALTLYLKVLKHRGKAFFTMVGVALMSTAVLVLGGLYIGEIRATDPAIWQTVAVDSGYFKECTKMVERDLQEVLTGINMESGVGVLGLDEDTVYRDVKSIFSARLTGKPMPEFQRRKNQIHDALHQILPKESIENVNHVTEVLLERYCKVLDTPYANYLYDLQKSKKSRNIVCSAGCLMIMILALFFLWKGTKYMHRRFRALSYGFGVAGVSFVVMSLVNRYRRIPIMAEPEAYRSLFEHYLTWWDENVLYLGVLLLVISLFAWAACYVTKGKHIEKLGLK